MDYSKQQKQIANEMAGLLECLKSLDEMRNDKINVFTAVGMGKQEVKHSYFLAWLLDPKKPHGLGNMMLTKFIEKAYECVASNKEMIEEARENVVCLEESGFKEKTEFEAFLKSDDIVVETEKVINTNERRIDVFVESKKTKTLIIIENKVFSGLHTNQLGGYEKEIYSNAEYAAYKKVWVFLTPFAILPIEDGIYYDKWCVLGYREIINCVDEILDEINKTKENTKIRILMEDYKEMVDKNILIGNKELMDVCKQIRRKYKDAMDVLYTYTNNSNKIREFYMNYILNDKYAKITVCSTGVNFDFYRDCEEKIFEVYNENIKIDKTRYKFRCRIGEKKGTEELVATAFLEKDEDEAWSPVQLAIFENTRNKIKEGCSLGRKYCTLFSVPLLDEYEVYDNFEKIKKKLTKQLEKFMDMVNKVTSVDMNAYEVDDIF